ncbi:MAG: UDP-N-acetylmuramate dehydrogenase [Conexibacter sp.]|nr:UDP-N-acetylmuramate dehydrogenase [Conexibacter sp.]
MDLSGYTTLRLGGPASELIEASTDEQLLAVVSERTAAGDPLLLLAGGSNVVVADEGFEGTVLRVATRGVQREGDVLHVAAGEPWDAFVARCVADGLAGIECLAGIPGSVGATPIQNVGAYGQDVSETVVSVRALDRATGTVEELTPEQCGFAYRSSAFKRDPGRWTVLRVSFALTPGDESRPVRYAELARALGIEVGATAPLAAVRDAVLALRRGKGMVLDPADPDTASAGSFFTNPILAPAEFAELQARTAERLGAEAHPPAFPEPGGRTKTSAAWLIERAGFARGHGDPAGIAISTKHVLALTNRGAGTTAGLVALAHEIADGVQDAFGVALVPEPVFVGHRWVAGAQPRA